MKMRQLKRVFLTTFLMGLLLCATVISASAEEIWVTVDGIVGGQILFDTSTGTITDADTSITVADIPSSINGATVTSIGDFAFENCNSLTSMIIPDNVTLIGGNAFRHCSSLTSVIIPDSVTSIGLSAFYGCSSLNSVTIPDSVTSIGLYAFKNCSSLTSVTIPDSVTSIEHDVFYGCSSLASVTIPDSVTSIGGAAFKNCSSLTSVTIPDSVTSIWAYAFENCSSLTSVTIPESVTSIEDSAFYGCSSLTSVSIPESVTSIEGYVFYGCSTLTSVTIPDSVASIGAFAFQSCSSLTSVTIPNSVTSIGYSAFRYCTSLTDVYYIGTEAEWSQISIVNYYNTCLTNATMHYTSAGTLNKITILTSSTQYIPYTTTISSVSATTTLSSGKLPSGLGLFSDGTISGIPTEVGTFTFTLSNGEEYTLTVQAGTSATIEAQNDYDIIEYVPEITSNAVDQIYHIDGPYADFLAFYINGNKLIEDVEFMADEGSTVITIFAQTFATESTGTHTISATFATDDSTIAQVSQQVTKTAEQIVASMPYTDVSESAWYYDYVYLMYRRGIIAGTSTTTYSPTSNLTRGMMVDALYQLAGAPSATTSDFSDVSADAWYADAVSWAAEVGVTQGVGDNMFAPDTSITREQMATMIQRYCDLMGITLPLYTSAIPTDLSTISSWAVDSATAMYQYGVLNGDENGNFNPSGTATRAEAASMFSNFLEILDRT